MNALRTFIRSSWQLMLVVAASLLISSAGSAQTIPGIESQVFNLTADDGYITTGDGDSVYAWGYGVGGQMQYPGPTLIVTAGQPVTVTLTNNLPSEAGNVSIVFPGQDVTAAMGVEGLLTWEAVTGGQVQYMFTPQEAGTYLYQSGTQPDLQVEMGLVGALIVRPSTFTKETPTAYNHADTAFDREYLFLLTEMDLTIHRFAEAGLLDRIDTADYWPVYWFINGRTAPDTLAAHDTAWLPNQPYGSLVTMHPGERVLLRIIGGGRHPHPFHTHGNHVRVIARDGVLESSDGTTIDLATSEFTIPSVPGKTVDAIFEWTGEGLGWDIYGTGPEYEHGDCVSLDGDDFDDDTHEYCPDHGKPLPVILPAAQNVAFGGFYSGSPFMGLLGSLPPGEGGLNPNAGFVFMWHSHTEKELTNNDLFPGGMMTQCIVEPRPMGPQEP